MDKTVDAALAVDGHPQNPCGNGVLERGLDESCDDGNLDDGNLDDGNLDDGAGCSATCVIEIKMQVEAGAFHTCTLLNTGKVHCWGHSEFGQLGYGNTDSIGDNETPDTVGNVDIGGTAVSIGMGFTHACALLDSGKVRCWGHGEFGQLGYGNTDNIGDNETPASAGDVPFN